MKEYKTNPGQAYVVTAIAVPCVVNAVMPDNKKVQLAKVDEVGQGSFVAVSDKIEVDQDSAIITPVFKHAPLALGAKGGGGVKLSGDNTWTGSNTFYNISTDLFMADLLSASSIRTASLNLSITSGGYWGAPFFYISRNASTGGADIGTTHLTITGDLQVDSIACDRIDSSEFLLDGMNLEDRYVRIMRVYSEEEFDVWKNHIGRNPGDMCMRMDTQSAEIWMFVWFGASEMADVIKIYPQTTAQ